MSGLTTCLSFDVDGMSSWIGSLKSNNPSVLSRGEFTQVATPRILDLLKRQNILASFAVPGHTACAFPDLVARIRDEGHELVHHGWVHENPAAFDEAGERRIIERGLEALRRAAGVTPTGYRSPAADFSKVTLKLLKEYGFTYDSTCLASDYYPYYLRTDDEWSVDEPYRFGPITDLVELPFNWTLDDFPAFEFVLGFNTGLAQPEDVENMWKGEFDFAREQCAGGIFNLTMHPETIGRGNRLRMLERLIEYMKEYSDVTFCRMGDYAARWKAENPLDEWSKNNPMRLGVGSITELSC